MKKKSATPLVQPRLLEIKAAAAYLATTVWFMRSLIWGRRIPFAKLGKRYVFAVADLDAFAQQVLESSVPFEQYRRNKPQPARSSKRQ